MSVSTTTAVVSGVVSGSVVSQVSGISPIIDCFCIVLCFILTMIGCFNIMCAMYEKHNKNLYILKAIISFIIILVIFLCFH